MVLLWIMALLSLVYYWGKEFSKARNNDFKDLEKKVETKPDYLTWIFDKLDEMGLSFLAYIILMVMAPYFFPWLFQTVFKIPVDSALNQAMPILLAVVLGYSSSWLLDKLLSKAKTVTEGRLSKLD